MRISDWSSDVCSSDLIDDAANGLAAPENRLWATQHFDTRRIPDEQMGEIIATTSRGRIVEFYSVDHHHGLIGFRTANAQRCRSAITTIARQADPARPEQQFGTADILSAVDRRRPDERRIGKESVST